MVYPTEEIPASESFDNLVSPGPVDDSSDVPMENEQDFVVEGRF